MDKGCGNQLDQGLEPPEPPGHHDPVQPVAD